MQVLCFTKGVDEMSVFGTVDVLFPVQVAGYDLKASVPAVSPAVQFVILPESLDQPMHPVPRRQLVVVLSGRLEVGTPDGQKREFRRGDIFLVT